MSFGVVAKKKQNIYCTGTIRKNNYARIYRLAETAVPLRSKIFKEVRMDQYCKTELIF
jgi:hypothetical protein